MTQVDADRAVVMLKLLGPSIAVRLALLCANDQQQQGDIDSCAAWCRILVAIARLTANAPEGEKVH